LLKNLWRHLKYLSSFCDFSFFKMVAGRHLGFCFNPKITSQHVAGCQWPPAHQIWWRYLIQRLRYGDFPFSRWRPAAILDFDPGQKWRYSTLRTVHVYHHAKFRDNISNGCRVIAIFFFQNGGRPPSWILLPVKNDVTARCGLTMASRTPNLVKISQKAAD